MTESLWFKDLKATPPGPREVLNLQARALTELTQGNLEGLVEVDMKKDPEKILAEMSFYIVVPSLNYYKTRVLTVELPDLAVQFYPLHVRSNYHPTTAKAYCLHEGDYVNALREIFGSPKLKEVVERLLAHV